MFARPSRAFGFQCDLQIPPGRSTRLIYLATEGHQTFGRLQARPCSPTWSCCRTTALAATGAISGRARCTAHGVRGRCAAVFALFSAGENTRVWPGYEAIAEPVLLAGQMHDYRRTLYQPRDGAAGLEVTGTVPAYLVGCGTNDDAGGPDGLAGLISEASPRHHELHPLSVEAVDQLGGNLALSGQFRGEGPRTGSSSHRLPLMKRRRRCRSNPAVQSGDSGHFCLAHAATPAARATARAILSPPVSDGSIGRRGNSPKDSTGARAGPGSPNWWRKATRTMTSLRSENAVDDPQVPTVLLDVPD